MALVAPTVVELEQQISHIRHEIETAHVHLRKYAAEVQECEQNYKDAVDRLGRAKEALKELKQKDVISMDEWFGLNEAIYENEDLAQEARIDQMRASSQIVLINKQIPILRFELRACEAELAEWGEVIQVDFGNDHGRG